MNLVAANIEIVSEYGFPLSYPAFQHMCQNMARARLSAQVESGLIEEFVDSPDNDPFNPGDIPTCGRKFFKR
jgi:hypothetical protein